MAEAYRLYAGTQAGMILFRGVADIWTSMGGSREFEPYFKDRVVDSVYGCKNSPEIVFAGVTFDGLYRTQDAGRHWQRTLEGDIRWVTVDPTDDRVIYAGTEPVHLYRSEDGGGTWEELKSLTEMPAEVQYKWYFPHPPHQGHVRHIYIDPEDSNCIYLALEHGGIVRSFDRGKTWEDVSEGLEYPDIHMIVRSPGSKTKYFTATSRGFFRADPPEKGWKRAEKGMESDYFHDVINLPGDRPAMFLAAGHGSPQYWDRPGGVDGRIYRSEDGGETWRQVGAGLPVKHTAMCWQLAYNPYDTNSIFAAFGDVARGHTAGPPGEGAIYVTYDRGDTWEEVGLQKRGTKYLRPPAIRVLWAAADE
jgi:photosystem II stability/assembly factor-like uncharacterized protein